MKKPNFKIYFFRILSVKKPCNEHENLPDSPNLRKEEGKINIYLKSLRVMYKSSIGSIWKMLVESGWGRIKCASWKEMHF